MPRIKAYEREESAQSFLEFKRRMLLDKLPGERQLHRVTDRRGRLKVTALAEPATRYYSNAEDEQDEPDAELLSGSNPGYRPIRARREYYPSLLSQIWNVADLPELPESDDKHVQDKARGGYRDSDDTDLEESDFYSTSVHPFEDGKLKPQPLNTKQTLHAELEPRTRRPINPPVDDDDLPSFDELCGNLIDMLDKTLVSDATPRQLRRPSSPSAESIAEFDAAVATMSGEEDELDVIERIEQDAELKFSPSRGEERSDQRQAHKTVPTVKPFCDVFADDVDDDDNNKVEWHRNDKYFVDKTFTDDKDDGRAREEAGNRYQQQDRDVASLRPLLSSDHGGSNNLERSAPVDIPRPLFKKRNPSKP